MFFLMRRIMHIRHTVNKKLGFARDVREHDFHQTKNPKPISTSINKQNKIHDRRSNEKNIENHQQLNSKGSPTPSNNQSNKRLLQVMLFLWNFAPVAGAGRGLYAAM